MHFIKLFLAGSFAVAAAFRGVLALLAEALGASSGLLVSFFTGPTGMLVETLTSFVLGAGLAAWIATTKKQKMTRA